jgi:hypothetical protein
MPFDGQRLDPMPGQKHRGGQPDEAAADDENGYLGNGRGGHGQIVTLPEIMRQTDPMNVVHCHAE